MPSLRLLIAVLAFAPAVLAKVQYKCDIKSPDFCVGADVNASVIYTYICGDYRLGPYQLPTQLPLDTITDI
jgi:hypothetical protein